MKLNIVILADYFAPHNCIAAVRPTKFAKYLAAQGHHIRVFCRTHPNMQTDNFLLEGLESVTVTYLKDSRFLTWTRQLLQRIKHKTALGKAAAKDLQGNTSQQKGAYSITFRLASLATFLLDWMEQQTYLNQLKKNVVSVNKCDVIFSTAPPLMPHLAARILKKEFPTATWIADFRDPLFPDPAHMLPSVANYYKTNQQVVLVQSTKVTAVAETFCELFRQSLGANLEKKVYFLSNGYDDDEKISLKSTAPINQFTFCYTGVMYHGNRDFTPLFRAISELIDEGVVLPDSICVHHAGPDANIFLSQAASYNMSHIIVDHGYVGRQTALSLQAQSHILLVSNWSYQETSISALSGKFFEYMLSGKPIISLMAGTIKCAELTRQVENLRLGVAYEQSGGAADFLKLKQYIAAQYCSFCESGKLDYTPDIEKVKQYSYKYLSTHLVEIIKK